jgi:hypothetical protein
MARNLSGLIVATPLSLGNSLKTGGFASPPFDGFAFVTQWNMQQSSTKLNRWPPIKLRRGCFAAGVLILS